MRRSGVALRRKPADTRLGAAAGKSWGKLERSNELFRESGDDGPSDGAAAIHCDPLECSCDCESRAFWRGAGGSVERYVSRRNAPRLDFLRYKRTTKIPCAKELSQAGRKAKREDAALQVQLVEVSPSPQRTALLSCVPT